MKRTDIPTKYAQRLSEYRWNQWLAVGSFLMLLAIGPEYFHLAIQRVLTDPMIASDPIYSSEFFQSYIVPSLFYILLIILVIQFLISTAKQGKVYTKIGCKYSSIAVKEDIYKMFHYGYLSSRCICQYVLALRDEKLAKILKINTEAAMVDSCRVNMEKSLKVIQTVQGKNMTEMNDNIEDLRDTNIRLEKKLRNAEQTCNEYIELNKNLQRENSSLKNRIDQLSASSRGRRSLDFKSELRKSVSSAKLEIIINHLKEVQKADIAKSDHYAYNLVYYYEALFQLGLIPDELSPFAKFFYKTSIQKENGVSLGGYSRTFSNAKSSIRNKSEEHEECIQESKSILLEILGRS